MDFAPSFYHLSILNREKVINYLIMNTNSYTTAWTWFNIPSSKSVTNSCIHTIMQVSVVLFWFPYKHTLMHSHIQTRNYNHFFLCIGSFFYCLNQSAIRTGFLLLPTYCPFDINIAGGDSAVRSTGQVHSRCLWKQTLVTLQPKHVSKNNTHLNRKSPMYLSTGNNVEFSKD